jgi:hypothetical protein
MMLELDYETADRITLLCLKDSLKTLKKEVRNHKKKGYYMHPEDLSDAETKYIPALEVLIKYYGGDWQID